MTHMLENLISTLAPKPQAKEALRKDFHNIGRLNLFVDYIKSVDLSKVAVIVLNNHPFDNSIEKNTGCALEVSLAANVSNYLPYVRLYNMFECHDIRFNPHQLRDVWPRVLWLHALPLPKFTPKSFLTNEAVFYDDEDIPRGDDDESESEEEGEGSDAALMKVRAAAASRKNKFDTSYSNIIAALLNRVLKVNRGLLICFGDDAAAMANKILDERKVLKNLSQSQCIRMPALDSRSVDRMDDSFMDSMIFDYANEYCVENLAVTPFTK